MQMQRSTILVTGGSSGLGAACVANLLAAGARVIIADVNPPGAATMVAGSDRLLFAATDVTNEAEVRAVISIGEQRLGPLRGTVVCAGILQAERLLPRDGSTSLEAFRRVIEVNLTGTFNTVRLAADAIACGEADEQGERGAIVMTSSVAAFEGQIGQAAYAASKGAVASMTLPLARELAQQGIRVVSIAPGVFETPMMQTAPENVRQSLVDQTLFPKRLGDPDEFAALVQHVFENRMLNGCVLRLDGAVRMGPR